MRPVTRHTNNTNLGLTDRADILQRSIKELVARSSQRGAKRRHSFGHVNAKSLLLGLP